jgi:chaperone LolA
MRKIFVLVAILFGAASYQATAETAQEILENVRKKYDSIDDAQLKFSQKSIFALSKIEQSATGSLLLKKENKYRVDTDNQTIVTDGKTVWSYSAANKQVLIDNFKMDENTVSPERILSGAPTDFTAALLGEDRIGKTETVVIKLTPKNEQSMIKTIKLWVDNSTWLIRKAEINDVNGKDTEYLVTDIKINTGVEDSRFSYQVPEGAEVVDLR